MLNKKTIFILSLLLLFLTFITSTKTALATDFQDKLIDFTVEAGFSVGGDSPSVIIANIVEIILSFLGVIFIILIIYAGFLWMTAGGNEEQVGRAKKIMVRAVIGLTIVLLAYSITYFVINVLADSTGG